MKARLLIGWVAGAAALTMMGCADKTPTYPGGTPGAAASLQLSQGAFELRQAATVTLGAQLRDSVGNPVAGDATFASCNAAIATVGAGTTPAGWNGAATVTALGVGSSCVTATAAGFTDTAFVTVGPYRVAVAGPAAAKSGVGGTFDPNPSKVGYAYKVTAFDPAGVAITAPFTRTWTTVGTQTLLAPVSRTGVADSVVATSQGSTGSVRVTILAIGGATATQTVTIGDGDFTGTITASNALTRPGVDNITITPNNGVADATKTSPLWTAVAASSTAPSIGTPTVFVNGLQTFTTNASLTTTANVVAIIPPTGVAAGTAVPVRILSIGGGAITQVTSAATGNQFTVNNSTGTDGGEPGNNVAATAPNFNVASQAAVPVTINMNPNFNILVGTCSGGTATTPASGVAGTDCDDWVSITNSLATTRAVAVNLAWFTNADVDLWLYQTDGVTLIDKALTRQSASETISIVLAPNQNVKLRANLFSQGTNAPTVTGAAAGSRATLIRWQMVVQNN